MNAILIIAMFLTNLFSAHDTSVALNGSGSFRAGGAYPTTTGATAGPAFGSWSGSDTRTGKLTSATFAAPLTIEFKVAGYPRHPGNSIQLQRTDTGATYVLEPKADPGESWQATELLLPVSWFHKRVRFIAVDNSRDFQGWLGISDVRTISVVHAVVSIDRLQAVFALPLFCLIWLLPGVALFIFLTSRTQVKHVLAFPISLICASLLGFVTFFLALLSPAFATIIARTVLAGSLVLLCFPLRRRLLQLLCVPDATLPFSITLASSLAFTSMLIVTSPGDPLAFAAQHAFGFALPDDNILPGVLSDRVFAHASPRPFVGDWLSSDRPPLQSGIDLYVRSIAYNGPFSGIRYQLVGTLCQTISLGIIYTLARSAGATVARSVVVVIGCALSGFFLVNSTFVWPKLLAGGLAGAGIVLFLNIKNEIQRSVFCGLALGLAMMAHGGVVFTLPILIIFALLNKERRSFVPYIYGLLTLSAILLPWQMYQHFIDPPGDRLLKWHLAGDVGVDNKTFLSVILNAYTSTPLHTLLRNKLSNIEMLFAPGLPLLRYKQFFGTIPALGALLFGVIGIAYESLRSGRSLFVVRTGSLYVVISLASLILWCVTMFGPNAAVVHQGSYLTIMLLMTGLMLGTLAIPYLAFVTIVSQALLLVVYYFLDGLTLRPVTLDTISGAFVATATLCVVVLQLQQSSRYRRLIRTIRTIVTRASMARSN